MELKGVRADMQDGSGLHENNHRSSECSKGEGGREEESRMKLSLKRFKERTPRWGSGEENRESRHRSQGAEPR